MPVRMLKLLKLGHSNATMGMNAKRDSRSGKLFSRFCYKETCNQPTMQWLHSGHLSQRNEGLCSHRNLNMIVQSSFILNSFKLQTTQTFFTGPSSHRCRSAAKDEQTPDIARNLQRDPSGKVPHCVTPPQSILEMTELWEDGEQVSGCQGRRDLGAAVKGRQKGPWVTEWFWRWAVSVSTSWLWPGALQTYQMSSSGRLGTGH